MQKKTTSETLLRSLCYLLFKIRFFRDSMIKLAWMRLCWFVYFVVLKRSPGQLYFAIGASRCFFSVDPGDEGAVFLEIKFKQ
jgi:hypothetical protein